MTERDFCCREKTSFSSLKKLVFPKGLFHLLFLSFSGRLANLYSCPTSEIILSRKWIDRWNCSFAEWKQPSRKKKINPSLKTVLLTRWKDFGGRKTAGALIFSFSVITFKFALYVSSSMTLFAKKISLSSVFKESFGAAPRHFVNKMFHRTAFYVHAPLAHTNKIVWEL